MPGGASSPAAWQRRASAAAVLRQGRQAQDSRGEQAGELTMREAGYQLPDQRSRTLLAAAAGGLSRRGRDQGHFREGPVPGQHVIPGCRRIRVHPRKDKACAGQPEDAVVMRPERRSARCR